MKKVKLDNYVDILSGFAFKSSQFNDNKRGLPIVRIRNVKPAFSETYYDGEFNEKFLLNNGDILIGMDGEFNCEKWQGGKALLNQRVCRIKSISDFLDDQYLFYYLSPVLKIIEGKSNFVTVKHLSVKQIQEIKIPLPPIASQRRIADILDKADEIIRKRKEAIALTEQLQKSIFLDMFGDPVTNPKGWDVVTLEQVAEKEKGAIKCGPFGSQLLISEFQDIGIPVYGIDNVQKNEFIWAKPKFITREKYQQLRAFSIKSNDVLISRTGTVGRTCIAPPNIPESIIGANLLKVSLDQNKMSSKYLSYALSYSEFLIQEIKNISPGATVPVFNTSNLKSLKLANPPIDLQIKFNLIINKIQEKIGKQGKYLQESENLFNSLLQKAFKGEL
jgi:type I restriction enzyme S subunit